MNERQFLPHGRLLRDSNGRYKIHKVRETECWHITAPNGTYWCLPSYEAAVVLYREGLPEEDPQ